MFTRKILIVDDEVNIEALYIPAYVDEIEKIKQTHEEYCNYKLEFKHIVSIEGAVEYLQSEAIVDVLIIDYKFNNNGNKKTGVDLIKFIRENINKHCKVIFYTMNALSGIPFDSYIELINNQVFRIVDKAHCNDYDFSKIILEAAVDCDFIVNSLENFWIEYGEVFNTYQYTFLGEKQNFSELLNHIRMNDKIGKSIVNKLMHKALIDSVEV